MEDYAGLRENRQNRTTFSLNTAPGIVRRETSGINIQTHEINRKQHWGNTKFYIVM